MKEFSFFERCLSYIRELPVTTVQSEFNPALEVSYYKGRFRLSGPNAVYSFEDNYTSFKTAFQKLQPEKRNIKKTLVLGFGLGSIPIMLTKYHRMNCDYTAVEIDPVVIELARKYSNLPEKLSIEMVCMDAYEYVAKSREKFDLINVDLFIDDETPEKFTTVEFLQELNKILSKNGLLIFSRMYHTPKQKKAAVDFFENVFRKIFPGSRFILTRSNLMLVVDKLAV